jgi:predicted MPP superfamily phosphohydrolase
VLRLAITLAVLGLINFYLYRRLIRDTRLVGRAKVVGIAALVVVQAPMVIVRLAGGAGPPSVQGAMAWPVFIGWAIFGLTFVGLLAIDVVKLVAWLGTSIARRVARRDAGPANPSRRQALARIGGGVVLTTVGAQVAVGARGALSDPDTVTVEFALDGYTIVQLSDVHIGATIGRDQIAAIVAQANRLGGDAIAITGDLVDGSVAELAPAAAPLAELRAPDGVFFVTGNHEYYSGADAWVAHLGTLGIRVLRNERVELVRGGAAFDLAGIDDHVARDYAGHGADLPKALAGRDGSRALVLLAHQPRQVHVAAQHDVDLQISGHTHGGQLWPWHYIVKIQQGGLLAGRYTIGRTQLYVSRGTGYWGPPLRLGAPAEITRIVLRSRAVVGGAA